MAKWGEIKCPRCAELEAELVYTEKRLEHAFDRNDMQAKTIDDLTTKLAQALRALERIELSTDTREQGAIAMATLAALKGQGDE